MRAIPLLNMHNESARDYFKTHRFLFLLSLCCISSRRIMENVIIISRVQKDQENRMFEQCSGYAIIIIKSVFGSSLAAQPQ